MKTTSYDFECAATATQIDQRLAADLKKQEIEDLCTQSSAVLVENGPYAFFLYLWSVREKRKPAAGIILDETFSYVARAIGLPSAGQSPVPRGKMMPQLAELATDLNRLLLAKKLILQVLVYLRYHAKARKDSSKKTSKERHQ